MCGANAKLPDNKMAIFTIFSMSMTKNILSLGVSEDFYEIRALYHVEQNEMDNFEQAIKDVLQFYDSSSALVERTSQLQYLMYRNCSYNYKL